MSVPWAEPERIAAVSYSFSTSGEHALVVTERFIATQGEWMDVDKLYLLGDATVRNVVRSVKLFPGHTAPKTVAKETNRLLQHFPGATLYVNVTDVGWDAAAKPFREVEHASWNSWWTVDLADGPPGEDDLRGALWAAPRGGRMHVDAGEATPIVRRAVDEFGATKDAPFTPLLTALALTVNRMTGEALPIVDPATGELIEYAGYPGPLQVVDADGDRTELSLFQ